MVSYLLTFPPIAIRCVSSHHHCHPQDLFCYFSTAIVLSNFLFEYICQVNLKTSIKFIKAHSFIQSNQIVTLSYTSVHLFHYEDMAKKIGSNICRILDCAVCTAWSARLSRNHLRGKTHTFSQTFEFFHFVIFLIK